MKKISESYWYASFLGRVESLKGLHHLFFPEMNCMNVSPVTFVGIIASIGTALSMVPQLTKLIKEKKAGDISINMLIVLLVGIGCWVAYGLLKKDWIIIISNSFSFAVNLVLTSLTIKYKAKTRPVNLP